MILNFIGKYIKSKLQTKKKGFAVSPWQGTNTFLEKENNKNSRDSTINSERFFCLNKKKALYSAYTEPDSQNLTSKMGQYEIFWGKKMKIVLCVAY